MNQKHAREARIINRMFKTLLRKDQVELDERGRPTLPSSAWKLARDVKANFDKQDHRAKGKMTRNWRGGVARSLRAAGVILKGDRINFDPRQTLGRRARRRIMCQLGMIGPRAVQQTP